MHTDQIYIARDGKSGMHVLVRILAVDDIGADYPPIDPDNFNKLMMARDVKSLVLAARDLGSMYMSVDSRPGRTFIPSHLQQDIECGFNLVPPDLESLLPFRLLVIFDKHRDDSFNAPENSSENQDRLTGIYDRGKVIGIHGNHLNIRLSLWSVNPPLPVNFSSASYASSL